MYIVLQIPAPPSTRYARLSAISLAMLAVQYCDRGPKTMQGLNITISTLPSWRNFCSRCSANALLTLYSKGWRIEGSLSSLMPCLRFVVNCRTAKVNKAPHFCGGGRTIGCFDALQDSLTTANNAVKYCLTASHLRFKTGLVGGVCNSAIKVKAGEPRKTSKRADERPDFGQVAQNEPFHKPGANKTTRAKYSDCMTLTHGQVVAHTEFPPVPARTYQSKSGCDNNPQ